MCLQENCCWFFTRFVYKRLFNRGFLRFVYERIVVCFVSASMVSRIVVISYVTVNSRTAIGHCVSNVCHNILFERWSIKHVESRVLILFNTVHCKIRFYFTTQVLS